MGPSAELCQEQRVGDRVRDGLVGEQLLRPALADVLIAAREAAERLLPGERLHDVEGDFRGRQRHQERAVALAEGEGGDDAHAGEGADALDGGAGRRRQVAARLAPDGELERRQQVAFGRRHPHGQADGAVVLERGDPAQHARVEAEVDHDAPPAASIARRSDRA